MNKALLIPRTPRQLVLQALAMVALVEVIVAVLFRYRFHVRMPRWFWAGGAVLSLFSLSAFCRSTAGCSRSGKSGVAPRSVGFVLSCFSFLQDSSWPQSIFLPDDA